MPEDEIEVPVEQPEEPEEPETPETPEVPEEPEQPEGSTTDYRGKLNAQNNFLKKEGYVFKDGKWVKPATTANTQSQQSTSQHSLADLHALGKVHEDDVERVEKYAKAEGVSIKEALKSDELQAVLKLREEKRTTAKAANVSTSRTGSGKTTDEALLKNAEDGKLPDDDAGIDRLIAAKLKVKKLAAISGRIGGI